MQEAPMRLTKDMRLTTGVHALNNQSLRWSRLCMCWWTRASLHTPLHGHVPAHMCVRLRTLAHEKIAKVTWGCLTTNTVIWKFPWEIFRVQIFVLKYFRKPGKPTKIKGTNICLQQTLRAFNFRWFLRPTKIFQNGTFPKLRYFQMFFIV